MSSSETIAIVIVTVVFAISVAVAIALGSQGSQRFVNGFLADAQNILSTAARETGLQYGPVAANEIPYLRGAISRFRVLVSILMKSELEASPTEYIRIRISPSIGKRWNPEFSEPEASYIRAGISKILFNIEIGIARVHLSDIAFSAIELLKKQNCRIQIDSNRSLSIATNLYAASRFCHRPDVITVAEELLSDA